MDEITLLAASTIVASGALIFSVIVNRRAVKTEQVELYFLIAQRWTATLQILYEVRQSPPPTLENLEADYGAAYQNFMFTDDWKRYRAICNFFEDIGLIVYKKNLDIGTIMVLVTVSPNDYLLMKPVLVYLRKHYRPDIYHFWNYLLEQRMRAKECNKEIKPYRAEAYEPLP